MLGRSSSVSIHKMSLSNICYKSKYNWFYSFNQSVIKLLPARRRVRPPAITVDRRVTSLAIAPAIPSQSLATSAGKKAIFPVTALKPLLIAVEAVVIPAAAVAITAIPNVTAADK